MAFRCRVISGGYCEMNQGYKKGTHYGVDIVGKNYTLANILAHSDGVVVKVRGNCNKTYSSNEAAIKEWGDGFGNFVMIKHIDGYYTQYEHLAYNSVKVKVGDKVKKGDIIGYMGSTGNANGAHLHFQVNKSTTWNDTIDPTPYLDSDFLVNPVNKDRSVNQIYVNVSDLRVRDTYSLNSNILGILKENSYYNYYDVKENEGYTWYKLSSNEWVGNRDNYLTVYPKITIEDLEAENELLKKEINILKEEIASIKSNYKVIFKIGKYYLIKEKK